MKNKSISNSVSIQIKPPENFSISGNTKVIPREEKEISLQEKFLENLYNHLEYLEEQKQEIIKIIEEVKKKYGCKCKKL